MKETKGISFESLGSKEIWVKIGPNTKIRIMNNTFFLTVDASVGIWLGFENRDCCD